MKRGFAAGIALAMAAVAWGHEPAAPEFDYARARETPFGKASDPARAERTIEIEMSDAMRYTPALVEVKRGERVRFVARNSGSVMHEMVLGTMADLAEHAEMMKKHPDMHHEEPNMLHVAPGAKGEMGWQFTRAGEFSFGCLVPGHFEAGMIGKVVVK
jgi:uncharacterized cupredoxin-like copper-binding protein